MQKSLIRYSIEVVEFLNAGTIEQIDLGILDLSQIRDLELRQTLTFVEEILTFELKLNYMKNPTGIFRVHVDGKRYSYREFDYEIESDSIVELKRMVLDENRIWYVFDEVSASRILEEGT